MHDGVEKFNEALLVRCLSKLAPLGTIENYCSLIQKKLRIRRLVKDQKMALKGRKHRGTEAC